MHAVLLLHGALPEGRRPARGDREARCRGDRTRHRPRHGREAREVVRALVRDDRLAARDGARSEDAGRRLVDQADEVRDEPDRAQQGGAVVPASRRQGRRRGAQPAQDRACAGPSRRARPGAGRARARKARAQRRRGPRSVRAGLVPEAVSPGGESVKRVAYYKGCLASLSAKELDTSTQALAPRVGLELVELESVTCCGAGDIHEAEPDYYLHLNARILAYAEATGCDTLMTVCNVCTLNLRQANYMLHGDE